MEKMLTDEEIVKALECLVKDGVYYGGVVHLSDILAFIHRLQAENERLTEENSALSKGVKRLKKRYEETIKQNAVQLAVCDFCETREEAEKRLKELQNDGK